MSRYEFEPLEESNDAAYRAKLIAEQVMPTAIICIRSAGSDEVYSVSTGNRASGFPTAELASMQPHQPVSVYVGYKLQKRFGLHIPRSQIEALPYVSTPSPFAADLGNDWFPDTHYRKYFPFLATVDSQPTSRLLVPIAAEEAVHNVVCPGGTEAIEHFARLHAEILERFAGIETV